MSEIRLVVRELQSDWSGNVHGSCGDWAIAALSADPITLTELRSAMARFARPELDRPFLANLSAGLRDEPHDAGIIIIDLVARLIVTDSTWSSPGPSGDVRYHDGQCSTDAELSYHLADDWLITSRSQQWRALADARRAERTRLPLLDARAVFYGRPLVEFIGRESLAAFTASRNSQAVSADAVDDIIRRIHAAWLSTARADLGGACPRDVALARRKHLSWDLEDRCQQWSLMGKCPPGLDQSSFAFRFGGFGTHELVKYYDLTRALLWSCWEQLVENEQSLPARSRPSALFVADYLTTEVPRLESVRDIWLDTPDPECHFRTPRSIIDRERARLPEGMSGRDGMVDPDCPCCQMMADLPGPMFWHLDGSGMDDEFAFDIYHCTREEWDEEQRRWHEFNERFAAEQRAGQQPGAAASAAGGADDSAVWSSSFSASGGLFGIGCHLAELIGDIRGNGALGDAAPEDRQLIDRLNREFGNLREVLQAGDPAHAEALVDPVIDRFAETLSTVAAARPELAAKCAALTELLGEPCDGSSESAGGSEDAEEPF